MLKRIRETPPNQSEEKRKPRPPSKAERLYLPERQEQAEKLADFAHTLGIDLSNAALRRMMLGEVVDIEGNEYRAGHDGEIRLVSASFEKRKTQLTQRISQLSTLHHRKHKASPGG